MKTSNPTNTNSPAPIEMDYSAAANRYFAELCVQTAALSRDGLSIVDAIYITSKNFHGGPLDYHRGPYEYRKARNELVKLICFAGKPTRFDAHGNPTNARPAGVYNHLLGNKIFPDSDKNRHRWAGNVKPLPTPSEYRAPTGLELELVVDLKSLYHSILVLDDGVCDTEYDREWWEAKAKQDRAVRNVDLEKAIASLKGVLRIGRHVSNIAAERDNALEQVRNMQRLMAPESA